MIKPMHGMTLPQQPSIVLLVTYTTTLNRSLWSIMPMKEDVRAMTTSARGRPQPFIPCSCLFRLFCKYAFNHHFKFMKHNDPYFGQGTYGQLSCFMPECIYHMKREASNLIGDDGNGWKNIDVLLCTLRLYPLEFQRRATTWSIGNSLRSYQ
jgi:hypothetical protein